MWKIAIIWPAFPYRWGIAHHTNCLVNSFLEFWHTVSVFTFSRQYPWFLYPWNNQIEPEWTSNPFSQLSIFSLYRIIDTINPFSWYKTAQAIIKMKPNYCLIKYWHPYFVPCFIFIAWLLRRKNIRLICIIDNLLPHERHFWDTILTKLFFLQIDRAITQSNIVHNQCRKLLPCLLETMIPHPNYDQFWPKVESSIARKKLGFWKDKIILLFFGFIRPYKWLDILLEAMPSIISTHPNIHLLIAGECFGSFQIYQDIIDKLKISRHVTLHLKYIPNNEIPIYFWACNLLVMPYRTATNSGIDNIGRIYASHTLFTVWYTLKQLILAIESSINEWNARNNLGLSWEEYRYKIENFIKD